MTDTIELPADHLPGANNPPADEPAFLVAFKAHKTHMDDLYVETKNWADGTAIETAEQAEVVDALIAQWKEAEKGAKASEVEATEPFQAQVKSIQQLYWELIGNNATATGIAVRAKTALLAVKGAWGRKQEQARLAEVERLRKVAAEEAAAAIAATRAAVEVGDIDAMEDAEALLKGAKKAQKAVARTAKETTKGMRDDWKIAGYADPVDGVTGQRALISHYLKTRPDDMLQAALQLAWTDLRNGKRAIPGVVIVNDRKAV